MANYQYKAATPGGEVIEGVLAGETRAEVVRRLQADGQVPIRVEEARARVPPRRLWRRRRRVTQEEIADVTRELGTLLRAGLPLDRALSILISLAGDRPLGGLLSGVRQRVKDGATLAGAMEAQGPVFSPFYLSLVRAAEAGGALDVVLDRLADYMARSRELRSTLVSALIYPATLIVVAVVAILILLGYVVPQFTEMFEGFGHALPLSTRVTIAVGEGVRDYGWLLLVLVPAAIWWVRRQLADRAGAYRWHAWLLRLPLIGGLVVRMEIARFAHTLSTLLRNGIPLLKALSIVKDTMGNRVLAEGLERVAGGLKEGQSLADPLSEVPHVPAFAVHMIRVGEESGELEAILEEVAATYDRDTRVTIKRALTLLEPMLILVLGVIIAAVIISILVAILGINELVV